MGDVAAKIRIMPTGMDVDLNELKKALTKAIPKGARLHGFSEEAGRIRFKALMFVVKVGDLEGGTELVEEAFGKVKASRTYQLKNSADVTLTSYKLLF